jgi:hypothetical protein
MGGELIWVAVQLVVCIALGAALLRFVPPKASRTWATGLLIFAMLSNLEPLIGVVVAHFSPPSFYLETEKNRLEFNRDQAGAVVGVRVNNPPSECLTYFKGDRPNWAMALASITLTLVALVLWRRAGPEVTPATASTGDSGVPGSQPRSGAGV